MTDHSNYDTSYAARLNADGEEIPTDEEEEIERSRTARRVRAVDAAPSGGDAVTRLRLEYLSSSTRDIRSFRVEEEDADGPRYVQSSTLASGQHWHFGPAWKDEIEEIEDVDIGGSEESYVNPLPLPLELPSKPEPTTTLTSRTVSRISQLAAR